MFILQNYYFLFPGIRKYKDTNLETENGDHGASTIMPYMPANSDGSKAHNSDDWWPNETGSWWDQGGCDTGPLATELVPCDQAHKLEIELAEGMKKDRPLFKLLLYTCCMSI